VLRRLADQGARQQRNALRLPLLSDAASGHDAWTIGDQARRSWCGRRGWAGRAGM